MLLIIKIVINLQTAKFKITSKIRHGMQEVIGSTPIFSTSTINRPASQLVNDEAGLLVGKTLPIYLSCDQFHMEMNAPSKLYTLPILNKGKEVKVIPKGSTKSKQQAKLTWYVDFSFFNPDDGKMERFRKTNGGNRIKDPSEKLQHFTALRDAYKELLENGYNPLDERSNDAMKKSIVSITLEEGKERFVLYHKSKGTRKKSIQTYLSKVNYFITHLGSSKKVNEITDYEITDFLNQYEASEKWTGVTYNSARIALNNYFRFLKTNKYIQSNPVTDTETRKEIDTEQHQVFSDNDFALVMNWLKANDPYTLLFVKTIYYTCIRPKELRMLQLKHISLETNTITVPASIAKNKKAIPVNIDGALRLELDELHISEYPADYYLFGSTKEIIGENMIGENTPYNRFHKCLDEVELLNKNYTLYSFKHLSNVKKFKAGWTIAEICAANRHSSLVETETYLKDLIKFVKTDKAIPPI
jgi:integrase